MGRGAARLPPSLAAPRRFRFVPPLADLTAVRALAEWDYDRLEAAYIPAQYPASPAPGGVYSSVTDEPTSVNVTVVSSGWGDGYYPTFIGYTASGAVASFVTDFQVIPGDAVPVVPTADTVA